MARTRKRVKDDRLDDLVTARSPVHMNQQVNKFGDRRDHRERDRSTKERKAIERDQDDSR